MKRDIITTIEISKTKIKLTVLEKLAGDVTEIFNSSADINFYKTFIKKSLQNVEKTIGGKIQKIGVIIEPFAKVRAKIYQKDFVFELLSGSLTKKTLDEFGQDMNDKIKAELQLTNRHLTLIKPYAYQLISDSGQLTKEFENPPFSEIGEKIVIRTAITAIDHQAYQFIKSIAVAIEVEISQILIKPQAISNIQLSEKAQKDGAILINVNRNLTSIAINEENTTKAFYNLKGFGFENLTKKITNVFDCSKEDAWKLLSAHGSMAGEQPVRTIYTSSFDANEIKYSNIELRQIVIEFLDGIVNVVKKFINYYKYNLKYLVVSGKITMITNLSNFFQEKLPNYQVSLYNPKTFIEMNEANITNLGLINFINKIDKTKSSQFDTVIHTNPKLVSTLKSKTKDHFGWLIRVFTRKSLSTNNKGEKYD